MNTPWPKSREVEKPKPIKVRAADAATKLINAKLALDAVVGNHTTEVHGAMVEAIAVLRVVAGEK